jgi:hypothetical protein
MEILNDIKHNRHFKIYKNKNEYSIVEEIVYNSVERSSPLVFRAIKISSELYDVTYDSNVLSDFI